MNKLLSQCPVCSGQVHVTEIGCEACGTRVRSDFEVCRFCSLTQEQQQFLELFLRHRGNNTSVGEALGVSHPTVTRRLEAVIAALNSVPATDDGGQNMEEPIPPAVDAQQQAPSRKDTLDAERARILELLNLGEISADEAAQQLSELRQ